MRTLICETLILLTCLTAAAQDFRPQSGPRLQLSTRTLCIGPIKADTTVTDSVTITNGGNLPLLIRSIHSGCGCTDITYPADTIAPSASATLRITYTPATDGIGPFSKQIRIRSNALNHTEILTIKGEICAE